MIPIYIGFLVVLVAIFLAFFIARQVQDHQYAVAIATPTPGPDASAKPIQLADLQPIGKPFEHNKGATADSKTGGLGSAVDGIACETTEGVRLHVHAHLSLFVNGVQMQIPQSIGIAPDLTSPSGACLYWIHTHGTDGIIHIESPQLHPPSGGPFTLGMMFDIWGTPLSKSQVGPFKGPVTAYVNGAPYDGDLHAIALLAHQEITLEVGKPLVPPPHYIFPPND